jgi:cell division protein FtsW
MQRLKTDRTLFLTTLAMVTFGVVILYSASSVIAELRFHSPWHYVWRQGLWLAPSFGLMMLLKMTDYRRLQTPVIAFGAIGMVLILLCAVFFIDPHHRWLRLGPVGLQPSELAKPALVIFLAFFVAWRGRAINAGSTLKPALLVVGLVIFGVVIADLGTAVVLGVTATVVFFVAGLKWRYCWITLVCAFAGLVFFIAQQPYRVARLAGYFPAGVRLIERFDTQGRFQQYLHKSLTSRDPAYQAEQSKIAVGSGGVLGVGLMQGRQKLLYLPEAHTDFIYAVASEEMGLVGSVGLLLGFALIFWRGLRAAHHSPDDFGRYLALGIATLIVVQGFMNISVVLGIMPTKGIPLPMISAGGSSLLSTLALLGVLMSVSERAGA